MAETRWLTGAGYFACVLLGIEKGPRYSFHALTFFFFCGFFVQQTSLLAKQRKT